MAALAAAPWPRDGGGDWRPSSAAALPPAQQAQQALVQDVRDEMMVELLAVLQGAAGACAKVCLSRLSALREQLLADLARDRQHLQAEAERLARLRWGPAPLPEQRPAREGAGHGAGLRLQGAWEPLEEDRGGGALLGWRRASSTTPADKGLARFDLSGGDSSGGEDWQDHRRSSLEERYEALTTMARSMQAEVPPPRAGGPALGRLQVRQHVPRRHSEAAAAEMLAGSRPAGLDAAPPPVAPASFAEFGRGVHPLRLSPKPVEEGCPPGGCDGQPPRRLAAVWRFWQNAESAPPAKGQREARRTSCDLTLDQFLSEGGH